MKVITAPPPPYLLNAKYLFWLAFIVSSAIAIRPAAIWLIVPFFTILVINLYKKTVRLPLVSLLLFIAVVPSFIQIAINISQFGELSILPASNLGESQVKWGIKYIKYGTWLGGGPPQNYYSSSNLIDNTCYKLGLVWYLYNPIDAIKLLSVKFVGAFDFDYLRPYVYSKPYIPYLASCVSFVILWFGLVTVYTHTFIKAIPSLGARFMPLGILLSWGAVSLLSALELRFTLPLLCYFIIISVMYYEFVFIKLLTRHKFYFAIACSIFVGLCYLIALFIRAQSSIAPYL